jgi:DNA processing protein
MSAPTVAADPPEDVQRARAYLSRVAEPPAPGLAWLVAAVGPVEAAARVRRGSVPEQVAKETAARRHVERAAEDLATAHACGARILTPEHSAWPHWAFAAFDNVAFGQVGHDAVLDEEVDLDEVDRGRAAEPVAAPAGFIGAGMAPMRGDLAPPLALWVRGPGIAAELCDQAAALVGARAATGYGLHIAGEFGAGLAAAGFTVVSGAAFGIDGAAHRGALAAGGPTIAVLACGIDRSYPAAHEALLGRIAGTGLVMSEYPPGAVPARHRFLVRNRLIAALAGGTVVVEAALRSGAQRTAADAQALGRSVMAVPGAVTSGQSAGCHRLIRDGAVLVTRIEEVLEEVGRIGVHLADAPAEAPARPTDGLGPVAVLVHDALPTRAARGVGWLAMEAGLPPGAVRTALGELSRRGLVEFGGGRWQRAVGESR